MSTRSLAFGGVISALSSLFIIASTLFHLITPLVVACILFYVCARKCGSLCAVLVIFVSNLIGFAVGGIGAGEILFSVLIFSPYSIIVFLTSRLDSAPALVALRAVIFAAFSLAVYILFITALSSVTSAFGGFGLGVKTLGVLFVAAMTAFGFALEKGTAIIFKRFLK